MSGIPISGGSAEDEELESSSSPTPASPLHSLPNDFRSALESFRDNWERELKGQAMPASDHQQQNVDAEDEGEDTLSPLPNTKTATEAEQQALAESLFRKAVELEQRGKVYDALPFYRKAVQIVPDIEFRFYEDQKLKMATGNVEVKPFTGARTDLKEEHEEEEELILDDLYEKFQLDVAQDYGGKLLLSTREAGVISTERHVGDLPPEILIYILRWVVSNQLDMRSLEQCAAVCKGMYLCARDEDLWRQACAKVWGLNVGTPAYPMAPANNRDEPNITCEKNALPVYASWRQMFIERERVLFSGCYISKTTYLRMGENSFQDQYYRPVQLVEYYRYIRFLPDGTVLMMTNADEPAQGVTKLRHLQQWRSDVLRGRYRLYGSTVTILLQKQQPQTRFLVNNTHARQRRGSALAEDFNSTKYCIEFRIMNTPKRKFSQLIWLSYSVVLTRNKVESKSEFDLTASKYPPLRFSPVLSYHLDAEAPLA